MISQLQEQMLEAVKKIRDEQRPEMSDVVESIRVMLDMMTQQFGSGANFKQISNGPDTWSWVDLSAGELGYERWYVLTGSTMEGTEGYPLFTVRSCVSPRLDSWISVSQLVVGPTSKAIETSLTMAIVNHQGAFEGLRASISDLLKIMSGDDPDGIDIGIPALTSKEKKDLN